jgi:Icc-related predicted phosphoesterase
MIIVAISDTHGYHDRLEVPDGDVLIHAGDITERGRLEEVEAFDRWLAQLPHRYKIVIAGNHDFCFQHRPGDARALMRHATYLQDEAVDVEGVKFYGSPWQPEFCDWAFNLPRGPALAAVWAKVPDDTRVLITHGPPLGIGDKTHRGPHAGCEDLLQRVRQVRPPLHVFGHIHEGAGRYEVEGTTFVNASIAGRGSAVVIECFGSSVVGWLGG